jgi:hypothetical protein
MEGYVEEEEAFPKGPDGNDPATLQGTAGYEPLNARYDCALDTS